MRLVLHPLALLSGIAKLVKIKFTKRVTQQLIVAISDGLGVAREGLADRTVYAVLGHILESESPGREFCPTFVRGEIQRCKKNRKIRTIWRVASALQQEAGIHRAPTKELRRRVAVPRTSTAIIPIGGDIDDDDIVATTTERVGLVDWYTLKNVPIGGIVYRISADHKITLYQKLAPNAWVRVNLDGASDVTDLPALLADMAGEGNRYTSVQNVTGPMGLIRKLPINYAGRRK